MAQHYIQFARSCEIARVSSAGNVRALGCLAAEWIESGSRRTGQGEREGGREEAGETRLTSNNGQQQGGSKQRADIGVAKSRFRGSQTSEVCSDNSP